ncbi:glycosyltransferase family 4 protein [Listeria booriae]|uniref:glycosyltransferase family 4 protein n=1 Tax=Listeria booriae TaxID=1552123 RepID=UPI0016251433|nr:glycosyltransferase [Listeria booriae]MBC2324680.1 glycosyltransferase [Listeria booriae]
MKALFAHDHRFYQSEAGMLSKNAFDAQVWERYLKHIDELIVMARVFELPAGAKSENYGVSSCDHVTFQHTPESHRWTNLLPKNKAQQAMDAQVATVDAVIARLPSRIGTMAVRAAKRRGKPYFIEVVGDPVESYKHHGSIILKLFAKHAGRMMKKNVASASHVIYVTNRDLQEKYPTNAEHTAASNVEIHDIPENMLEMRAAQIAMNHNRPKKIGMIATLETDYKGIDTAIEALQILKNKQQDAQLYILGPGDKTRWEELAQQHNVADRIVFCGILPAGQAVLNWLDELDLYIQPSRTEGVPRALIEAMARGCPAIGSVAGGIPELLSSEYTHEIANPHELAKKLSDLIQTPEKRQQQSQDNIKIAAQYAKPILEKRRAELFTSFFKTVDSKGRKSKL